MQLRGEEGGEHGRAHRLPEQKPCCLLQARRCGHRVWDEQVHYPEAAWVAASSRARRWRWTGGGRVASAGRSAGARASGGGLGRTNERNARRPSSGGRRRRRSFSSCGLGSRRAVTGGSDEGSPGKVTGAGNNNQKVESDLHSETNDGKEVYGSWNGEHGSPLAWLRAAVFFGQSRRVEALRGARSLCTRWRVGRARGRGSFFLEVGGDPVGPVSHVQLMNGLAPETTVAPCTKQLFRGLAVIHHSGFTNRVM